MLPIFKNRNLMPACASEILEDAFLTNFFESTFKSNIPAVNITEGATDYKIEVASPGLQKEDFKIDLENDILTISSEKKQSSEEKSEKFMRREFSYNSFRRSFILGDTVEEDKINASYKDGILLVSIPKKERSKEKSNREISIS